MKKYLFLFCLLCSFYFSSEQNVGIGISNPGFPLNFPASLGDKISLYGNSGSHYGFGIQSGQLQIHTDLPASDILFGYGSSSAFNEKMRLKGNGFLGIGTSTPVNRLDVAGLNNWDLTNSEGDMRIGNDSYRLKFGVALGGGGAGASGIMQSGGVPLLSIGANGSYQMQLNGSDNSINLINNANLKLSGNSSMILNGNAGSPGQMLTSNGGAGVSWQSPTSFLYNNSMEFIQTSNITTTNFSYVPGLTQTISTPDCKVLLTVKGQMLNNSCFACGSNTCKYDLWVDNTLIDRNIILVGNGEESVVTNGARIYTLSAGSHTLAVGVDGNGKDFFCSGFRLIAVVIPK